mmetsp:Transcript_58014/g.131452  ORF Transcript_58014/g.131452 Transcript_58014/m.131452 type:complete len:282 (+) Transcript_58014:534-1379(+)
MIHPESCFFSLRKIAPSIALLGSAPSFRRSRMAALGSLMYRDASASAVPPPLAYMFTRFSAASASLSPPLLPPLPAAETSKVTIASASADRSKDDLLVVGRVAVSLGAAWPGKSASGWSLNTNSSPAASLPAPRKQYRIATGSPSLPSFELPSAGGAAARSPTSWSISSLCRAVKRWLRPLNSWRVALSLRVSFARSRRGASLSDRSCRVGKGPGATETDLEEAPSGLDLTPRQDGRGSSEVPRRNEATWLIRVAKPVHDSLAWPSNTSRAAAAAAAQSPR